MRCGTLTLRRSSVMADIGGIVTRAPLALAVTVMPLALLLGSITGYAVGEAGSYRAGRMAAVSGDLARLRGDYVLAAGDSHIERWPARFLCGLPVVNAGISGATAASYQDFFAALSLARPPRAIILTIGTNDANRKRLRDEADVANRFEHGLRRLLALMRKAAPLVVLTGLPSIDPQRGDGFSPLAAVQIGQRARWVCEATPGCMATAAPGAGVAQTDGVHFQDYGTAYRGLADSLCPALSRQTPVRLAR